MPFRQRGSFGRRMGLGQVVDSQKNQVDATTSIGTGNNQHIIAKAVNSASNTVNNEVTRGCKIFRIWCEVWAYGTLATGVNNQLTFYFMKNPGNNLTPPGTTAWGTSNEKKFIFRSGKGLLGRLQDGAPPYQVIKRWLKIPKKYQRMDIDDVITLEISAGAAAGANICTQFIYKWYK